MNRVHLNVNGVSNENMKTQLKNSLEKVEGVNQVCVDMARETVEVIYNEPATEESIKSCIKSTGHIIK